MLEHGHGVIAHPNGRLAAPPPLFHWIAVYLLPAHAVAVVAARVLRPWLPRRGRIGLAVASLGMLVATQVLRTRAAEGAELAAFVERIRPRVASADAVVASPGLAEKDALVSSWLLGRPVTPARLACVPGTLVLAPARGGDRTGALGLRVVDTSGPDGVALLECARAP